MPDKNVQLPDGRVVAFPDSMSDGDIASAIKKQTTPQRATEDFTYPAAGPGAALFTTKVTPQEAQRLTEENRDARIDAGKQTLTALGAMAAPELLPEMAGSGFFHYIGRLLLRAGASGAGAGAGNATGQAISGQNPFEKHNLEENIKIAGTTAAIALPLEAIGQLASTKMGRGAINESVGASGRDVTYGNPARALLKEDITDIPTGDWEAYQRALRAGKPIPEAAQAAGGRFAAVTQRINELVPRLDSALSKSTARIPVASVIEQPIINNGIDILNNPAMTDAEKDAALHQLRELRQSLTKNLGPDASPQELQKIKQAIGNRVNWGGNIAVTDEVKPAYRNVYASIKEAINRSVPESAPINERLTDLLAAKNDLETLSKAEEVGRGSGITAGKIGNSVAGMVKSAAGRVLPGAAHAPALVPTGATIGQQLQSKGVPQPAANSPELPFHPGAGLTKP